MRSSCQDWFDRPEQDFQRLGLILRDASAGWKTPSFHPGHIIIVNVCKTSSVMINIYIPNKVKFKIGPINLCSFNSYLSYKKVKYPTNLLYSSVTHNIIPPPIIINIRSKKVRFVVTIDLGSEVNANSLLQLYCCQVVLDNVMDLR